MAPGIFCVWSRTDPGPDSSSESDETFSDAVTALQGVSRGIRFEAADFNPMSDPAQNEYPFFSLYELPDIDYYMGEEFAKLGEHYRFREDDPFGPRVYERMEFIEAEGQANKNLDFGGQIAVVTRSSPQNGLEECWKFHREVLVSALSEDSEFFRAGVYKLLSPAVTDEKAVPSSPFVCTYEWHYEDMPWDDLAAVGQAPGWAKHMEDDVAYQVIQYYPRAFSKTKDQVVTPRGKEEFKRDFGSSENREGL